MLGDVQDILGEQRRPTENVERLFATAFNKSSTVRSTHGASKSTHRPTRAPRPVGMAREVYNLLKEEALATDLTHLVPASPSVGGGYRAPKAHIGRHSARKWRVLPFDNPARQDGLQLRHWQCDDTATECVFAKFNKQVQTVTYTSDEYDRLLTHCDWKKPHTDHLCSLAKQFSLRWPVIFDRWDRKTYGGQFDVEEMKTRYYDICNKLVRARHSDTASLPVQVAYDGEHNRKRKEQLEKLWSRTKEDIEEEERLAGQLKRIEARKRERERKAADLQKLIAASERAPLNPAPVSIAAATALLRANQSGANLKSRGGNVVGVGRGAWALVAKPGLDSSYVGIKFSEQRAAGAHLRSAEMKLPNIGQKKYKAIENALERFSCAELNPRTLPNASGAITSHFNELRSDMALLYELHQLVHNQHFTVQELRMKIAALTDQPPFELSQNITDVVAMAEVRLSTVTQSSSSASTVAAIPCNVVTRTASTHPTPAVSPNGASSASTSAAGLAASRKRRLQSQPSSEVLKRARH